MPSRPPETRFYENTENKVLWRDVSRLYENFLGPEPKKWVERQERFTVALNDVLVRLREAPPHITTYELGPDHLRASADCPVRGDDRND